MNVLLENPLPIWAIGIVLTAIAIVVVLAKRTIGSVLALAAVIVLTLLLTVAERLVVTEREKVEQAVAELLSAIEANDLPKVLSFVDPTAQRIQNDANTLMPLVKVRDTGLAGLRIEIDDSIEPHRATAFFRGRIDAVHAQSGARLFYYDKVEIDWARNGANWQIVDYRASFRGKPIDAVNSFRSGRATR